MERIRTFSINLPLNLYERLLSKAGKRRVSTFIRGLVEKELDDSEEELLQEYKEAYQDIHLLKLAKKWEEAGIETWLNYEESRKGTSKKGK